MKENFTDVTQFIIEDDGQGFDVKERLAAVLQEKRMGLRSMQERGNLLGGNMKIQSRILEGTKIFIEVPGNPDPGGKLDVQQY